MGILLTSMLIPVSMSAQGGYQVKGVIVDAEGPVIGAAVLEQGTSNGTMTDLDGNYSLTVSSADAIIEVSCMSYSSQTFKASAMPAVITLVENAMFLEDAIVIGYGTVKKEDLTGSVATVRADDINKGMISSPSQLLAGKSGGVVVTAGDGQPGSASTIRIRGGSSLNANNSPLIVIDGLPVGETGISGVSDALSSINPNDIESFTVLKDASATAIYGSRASNGVIIITTKKGATGKIHVNGDITTSVSQNSKFIKLLDAEGMKAAMQQYYGSNADAMGALGTANTNWQKEIFHTGTSLDSNVGIGGSFHFGDVADLPYRVSIGGLTQKGTLKTSEMQRGTLSLNLSPTFLDKHLTVNLNGKGMYMYNRFANTGAVGAALEYDPTQPIYAQGEYIENANGLDYDADGKLVGIHGYRTWGTANTVGLNPVAALNERIDRANAYRFIGNAQFDYKIHGFEDLRLNLNLGIDASKSNGHVDVLAGSEQSWHDQTQNGAGVFEDYDQLRRDETLEMYADYTHSFANKHNVEVMGGYSWQHFYHNSNDLSTSVDGAKVYRDVHPAFEYFLVSFFGRANYGFDNKYLITATARYDGTSRFSNNKWGFFPSIAFAWNAKNEAFLKNVDVLSTAKLRLSWGQTGQQDVAGDSYPTLPTYYVNQLGSYYHFGNQVIIPIRPNPYNADLKWETTTTYNAGIDLGFLAGRITASLDVYKRVTTDLLAYTPIPAGSNLKNYLNANIGSLENSGVELDMHFIPIQTRDLFWEIGVNGAYNRNRVTKLQSYVDPSYKGVDVGNISGAVGNYIQKYMVGYPAPVFYVYQQIYDAEGKPIMGAYVDRNGDGKIDSNDKYYCKQAAPKFTIGLNTSLNYKNWTFAASAHSNLGNYVYDNNTARLSLITDLWTNNFAANRVPQGVEDGFTTAQYFSDYYIKNASFFKLDNVTAGYTFNLRNETKLNVFCTVQNVLVISPYKGIDPEIFNGIDSNIWPRPRTYVIGAKFNF